MIDRDLWLSRLENPIFVKFARSRLRRGPLTVSIIVVLILCICILWADFQVTGFPTGSTFGVLMTLQAIILPLMGAGQVGTSIANARASGILDFHRVSPLTPIELTLGFFFGAPVREYILFACTLPFAAIFLAKGEISALGFLQLMILLLATAWVLHSVALLSGLLATVKSSPTSIGGMMLVVFLLGGPMLSAGIYARRLVDNDNRLSFFGQSLPWLAVVLIYATCLLFFVFLATRRRIHSDRLHAFSKCQALGAFGTLAVVGLGGIWGIADTDIAAMVLLYSLALAAIVLIQMVTPDRSEYLKGLVRALKQGRRHQPWWHDLALNPVFLGLASVILLAAPTIAAGGMDHQYSGSRSVRLTEFPLSIATAVLTVAYFGLALQYCQLQFGTRGKIFFGLFLFVVWLVPIVAGTIVSSASSGGNEGIARSVFALTPLIGISLSAVGGDARLVSDQSMVRSAAITPALLFFFVFQALLVGTRRKIHERVLLANARAKVAAGLSPLE
jgi:hypothetical protein